MFVSEVVVTELGTIYFYVLLIFNSSYTVVVYQTILAIMHTKTCMIESMIVNLICVDWFYLKDMQTTLISWYL